MLRLWFTKLAWMLVSFKVWSFAVFVGLMISGWMAAEKGFLATIEIAKDLHDQNYINSDQLTNLISHSQTVYLDSLLGHLSVFGAAVIVSIITLKAVTDWQSISKDKEVIKKADQAEFKNGGLQKFLSKAGQ